MEESGHQDGAINLSTVREAASKEDQQLNGDITHNGENGHDSALPSQLPRVCFLALCLSVCLCLSVSLSLSLSAVMKGYLLAS